MFGHRTVDVLHRWLLKWQYEHCDHQQATKRNLTPRICICFKTSTWKSLVNPWRALSTHVKTGRILKQRPSSLASKNICRGGEWYLEKRGSRKILAGSRNLGSVFDKSRSLVFSWFVFTFFESRNFSPKSLGLRFLTMISASRQVSDFTARHPYLCGLRCYRRAS